MPAGMARIEVRFLIDANGILNVTARDARTGKEQTVEVKPSYGLTDEEVEQRILESIENAEADSRRGRRWRRGRGRFDSGGDREGQAERRLLGAVRSGAREH